MKFIFLSTGNYSSISTKYFELFKLLSETDEKNIKKHNILEMKCSRLNEDSFVYKLRAPSLSVISLQVIVYLNSKQD